MHRNKQFDWSQIQLLLKQRNQSFHFFFATAALSLPGFEAVKLRLINSTEVDQIFNKQLLYVIVTCFTFLFAFGAFAKKINKIKQNRR